MLFFKSSYSVFIVKTDDSTYGNHSFGSMRQYLLPMDITMSTKKFSDADVPRANRQEIDLPTKKESEIEFTDVKEPTNTFPSVTLSLQRTSIENLLSVLGRIFCNVIFLTSLYSAGCFKFIFGSFLNLKCHVKICC